MAPKMATALNSENWIQIQQEILHQLRKVLLENRHIQELNQ